MESLRLGHYRHHWRFYFAVLFGAAVCLLPLASPMGFRLSLGGATFFIIYLAASLALARGLTAEDLRKKATSEDEGILVIVVIALAAISLSLGSLVMLLGARPNGWMILPAVADVPLGWATLHTIMAFHYAHLYFAPPDEADAKARDTGGLEFPGTDAPAISDFFYFSFVVGMTAQTSDVDVKSRTMRITTLAHGIVSFFFNTVILALTVNVLTHG